MGVGVVELRLIVLHDLLQVRLCESRSDRELEVPYKYYVVWLTRALYFKASPGSRSRGAEA